MNRVLYQLSYAAKCGQRISGTAEISFVIISKLSPFVKNYFMFFSEIFGEAFHRGDFVNIGRKAALFSLGGCAYVGLELLWRGRSHGSMFLAGGASLVLVGPLNHAEPKLPFPLRAVTGAGIITMVELGAGLIFNRDYSVWDYRDQPGNLWGQICPLFSVLWIFAAMLVLLIYDPVDQEIRKCLQR